MIEEEIAEAIAHLAQNPHFEIEGRVLQQIAADTNDEAQRLSLDLKLA
jgi:hypothetical protein